MKKPIEQLVKYAEEAWAQLDHNEHELLASNLMLSIDFVKSDQKAETMESCTDGSCQNKHLIENLESQLKDLQAKYVALKDAAEFASKEYRVMVETNDFADHYLPVAMRQLRAVLKAGLDKDEIKTNQQI